MVHPRLNVKRVRKLIDALKDDKRKHRQIRGCLRRGISFDAGGLACYVSKLGHWKKTPNSSVYVFVLDGREYVTTVPKAVWDWYGFTCEPPKKTHRDQKNGPRFGYPALTLEYMNDVAEMKFWHIAGRLEQEIKKTLELSGETE